MIKVDIGDEALYSYLSNQLSTFLPDGIAFENDDTKCAFRQALERAEKCFSHVALPGFSDDQGNAYLSHLHTDQYAMFLYFFMNSLWKQSNNTVICSKVMTLNRMLHGFFLSFKCSLPEIFCLQHPLGTVLGNACYSDYLVVLQNVTVNTGVSDDGSLCPVLGKGLFLGAGSKIIGTEPIGDRCSLGVNAVVYNQRVEDDSIVISRDGGIDIVKRKKPECQAQVFFRDKII